jgi:hypothetical protein
MLSLRRIFTEILRGTKDPEPRIWMLDRFNEVRIELQDEGSRRSLIGGQRSSETQDPQIDLLASSRPPDVGAAHIFCFDLG